MSTYPTQEEFSKTFVLYYFGAALHQAEAIVAEGDYTLESALTGTHNTSTSIFVEAHEMTTRSRS